MMRTKSGSVLIEVLVAVSVAIVGLLALVTIGTKSVNNSGFATRQSQATGFASQALENVRARKQSLGWDVFKTNYGSSPRCGTTLASGCCTVGNAGEFNSCVTLQFVPASGTASEYVRVISEVTWSEIGRESGATSPRARQETVISRY